MIERVAEALALYDCPAKDIWAMLSSEQQEEYRGRVRAVLTELRQPGDDVERVGIVHSGGGTLCSWQSMLDHILTEGKGG